MGVAVNRLLLDCLADEEGGEITTQDRIEAEERARVLESLVYVGFDLEIS